MKKRLKKSLMQRYMNTKSAYREVLKSFAREKVKNRAICLVQMSLLKIYS